MEKREAPKYVWYASYGSNINSSRFLCYIYGGTPKGATIPSPGCKDQTPPVKDVPVTLKQEKYFARHSKTWNGAAAFLELTHPEGEYASPKVLRNKEEWSSKNLDPTLTYGRMYLITEEQFIDIIKQENKLSTETEKFKLDLDLDHFRKQLDSETLVQISTISETTTVTGPITQVQTTKKIVQKKILEDHQPYNYLMYLGEEEGFPIFTFTGENDKETERGNKPSIAYLQIIGSGLREVYDWDNDTISNYFLAKNGVRNHYTFDSLSAQLFPLSSSSSQPSLPTNAQLSPVLCTSNSVPEFV